MTTLSKAINKRSLAFLATGLLLAVCLAACKSSPTVTGKWFSTGKTLENGEQQKAILELTQNGNKVVG